MCWVCSLIYQSMSRVLDITCLSSMWTLTGHCKIFTVNYNMSLVLDTGSSPILDSSYCYNHDLEEVKHYVLIHTWL